MESMQEILFYLFIILKLYKCYDNYRKNTLCHSAIILVISRLYTICTCSYKFIMHFGSVKFHNSPLYKHNSEISTENKPPTFFHDEKVAVQLRYE